MFAPLLARSSNRKSAASGSARSSDLIGGTPLAAHRTGESLVREALRSSGRPLDHDTRAHFEDRFHTDLSRVRVHTDQRAAASARAAAAEAYTVGDHIAFAAGAYQPLSRGRDSLLAHELVHVIEDVPGLHRKPDPKVIKEFNTRAAAIRHLDLYKKRTAPERALAEDIIAVARYRSNALYYIGKLELLFNTPMAPPTNRAADAEKKGDEMAAKEQTRLSAPQAKVNETLEENLTAGSGKHDWIMRVGEGGKYFYINKRSPSHLLVRVKVLLTAGQGATAQDVKNIKSLEDGIEKASAARGYSVDLEFSNTKGPDVFEVKVNPSGWTDSGNWSALAANGPATLAHELHHLLGLPDRYNYIEAHANNASMEFADRLYWFREQMRRVYDPTLDRQSIMGSGNDVTETDVDDVAGLTPGQVAERRKDFKKQDLAPLLWQTYTRDQRSETRGSP